MTYVSLFSRIVVLVLAFYGLGTLVSGWSHGDRGGVRRLAGGWTRVDQAISTVVTSFILAVLVVWVLQIANAVAILGSRGTSWGVYVVRSSPAASSLIALSLSIAFMIALSVRLILTIPTVTRFVVKAVGESEWIVEFMEWCIARRNATIAGAMMILNKLRVFRQLFRW